MRKRDTDFGADLAWFEGAPFVLAGGLPADGWLSRRVREYGYAPVAFIVDSAAGAVEGHLTTWLGRPVVWSGAYPLGWRLGIEMGR